MDLIARRYHIAPWQINPNDPKVLAGLRRVWIFMDMESQRDQQIEKRHSKPRTRVGPT